jgi:HK97 family phage major capsid protein
MRGESRSRLAEHTAELATTESRTGLDTTLGDGGGFVPPAYLLELWTPFARAGKPLLNLIPKAVLPQTMTVNVPKIIAGSQVAVQATQNTTVTEVDLEDDYVTGNVVTLAGNQTVSLQLLNQCPISFDSVVFQDLMAAHAQVSDYQTIYGSGTNGQLLGLTNIDGVQTTSFAGTTTQNIYDALAQAFNMVWTTRYAAPDYLVVHPIVWADWLSKLDNEERPLFAPHTQGPWNAAGIQDNINAQGVVGSILGLQVVVDFNAIGQNDPRCDTVTFKQRATICFAHA